MGGLGTEGRGVGGGEVGRERALGEVAGGGLGVGGVGGGGEEGSVEEGVGRRVGRDGGQDGDDRDGVRGAGLHAGGGFAFGEAAVAHVAFADDAEAFAVLWNVIRALQHTILATDALVIEVADDAGERVLFVGENRAAVEAGGIGTVMAGGGDRLGERVGAVAADEEADVAPGFVVVEAVEGVAGGDAGFAAGAGVECDPEGVLFAGAGMGERD